jgi:RluA family pseudouridine synthase
VIPILFEDELIVVVNKPAGLPTLQDGWSPEAPFVKKKLEEKIGKIWVVHRLDRETSGVIVFARNAETHRQLNTQFEQHIVKKVYHALVHGVPDWRTKRVELALRINVGHHHRTVVDSKYGKPAITEFELLEEFNGTALIQALPKTGRTHQIRAHLAAIEFPIMGDSLYYETDYRSNSPTAPRMMLHASSLTFLHPVTCQECTFIAPYPMDFADFLCNLKSVPAS